MSNLNTLVLPEPVTWLIERSAFRVAPHGQDAESNEWLEEAHEPGEEGSFPVYTEQQVRALLATVTGKSGSNDSPLLAGVSAPAAQAAPAAQSVANADGRFTKNPVTIDAIKWTGSNLREVIAFTDGPPDTRSIHAGMAWEAYVDLVARDGLKIYTLEGKMLANIGDWIIRGIKGEYYPCKPDIFEATYTSAPQAQAVERGEVLVTVSGFTGSGKSAIAGEIEILCRALGLQVDWPGGDSEKNMTHADWTAALEQYKPRVRIVECNVPHSVVKGQDK